MNLQLISSKIDGENILGVLSIGGEEFRVTAAFDGIELSDVDCSDVFTTTAAESEDFDFSEVLTNVRSLVTSSIDDFEEKEAAAQIADCGLTLVGRDAYRNGDWHIVKELADGNSTATAFHAKTLREAVRKAQIASV